MRSYFDIQYGKLGHALQKLDVHLPDEGDSFPAFLYFHGGGFVHGDKAGPKDLEFAKTVTKNGVALISVNYRMYPDAKYPDFVEDAAEALETVGLVIGNIYAVSSGAPKGTVISQSVAPSTPINSNITSVDIYVSS